MDNISIPSYFRLAKNTSKNSTHYKYQIGAVLVSGHKVISVGYNQSKTHPKAWFTGLHAEIHALLCSGKEYIKGSSIFVYRETKDGQLAWAKPCINCRKALKEFGIKTIWFTTDEYPYFECERL